MNDEKKPLVMTIILQPDGTMGVNFAFLKDKITAYGFLKLAEKVLDAYYKSQENQEKIIKPTVEEVSILKH